MRCRKSQFSHSHAAWQSFFFLIAMQHGNAICHFCDTSPARMRFFHFCHTSPAISSEIMIRPLSNHCFGVTPWTTPNVNRHKNPRLLPRGGNDTKIVFYKNIRILFRILYFSNGFQQFAKSVLYKKIQILRRILRFSWEFQWFCISCVFANLQFYFNDLKLTMLSWRV